MNEFWRLLDKEHHNKVLRIDHANGSQWLFENGDWVRVGLCSGYLLDYGDYYGQYEVITEAEALELTKTA
jgi:hypothetical protein